MADSGVGCKDPVHQKKNKGFQTHERQGLWELSGDDKYLQCEMDATAIVFAKTSPHDVYMLDAQKITHK